MKKILITGANGFVGSRLLEYYKTTYQVIGYTHSMLDFTNEKDVIREVEKVRPDIVIHCGAISDTAQCLKEPELSYLINVKGSENIAKACNRYNAKLIFLSSDQVYFGSDESKPHKEDELLSPIHPYGQQKLEAEQRCAFSNLNTVSLRLSWMYDLITKNEKEHGNLFTQVLEALRQGKTMTYPVYDYRCITNVNDVVKNIEKVFDLPSGVYNFASENQGSTYDVVSHIINMLNADKRYLVGNEEAFALRPRNLSMDMEKIKGYGIGFLDTNASISNCLKGYNVML